MEGRGLVLGSKRVRREGLCGRLERQCNQDRVGWLVDEYVVYGMIRIGMAFSLGNSVEFSGIWGSYEVMNSLYRVKSR